MQKMTDGNDSGTKIKICGLRRREDILAVNEVKPDYCGFIIEFPSSFRSVTADEVRELVKELDPEIRPVGVFVNAPMELVRTLLDDGTLALVQLHGQEEEAYIRQLQEMIAAGEVYKETGIPMGVIYLAPIVGYGLALLRFIVQALGKKSR